MSKKNSSALQDFRRARGRATLQQIIARLTGRSVDLLSYEDVRRKLKVGGVSKRKLERIPLDAVVGSVGRYNDFTRSFLPRQDDDEERWVRVRKTVSDPTQTAPIEVYKIGQVYFVLDGNHRVSVARQLGATHIRAYVVEVRTKVPLSPDTKPDDLIIKAEYADFLEHTQLDKLRPKADLSLTVPGQYQTIEEHIEIHRRFMALKQEREIPYEEAAVHWYDQRYLPVVWVIREQGVLRDFPGRTETDLYLWVSEHQALLKEELGWEIEPGTAAIDLAERFSPKPQRVAARVGERILNALKIPPPEVEAGPPPGQWRQKRLAIREPDRMFADVLVAINGEETGWYALEHALFVARYEKARVHGLHVAPYEYQEGKETKEKIQAIRAEFERRCAASGVPAEMAIDSGDVSRNICRRARWTDLVIVSLNYPPPPQPIARLSSGLSNLIRRCPRPLLAVPANPRTKNGSISEIEPFWPGSSQSRLQRALLAYDGSPKSEEALFVAAYLAGRWRIPLVVMTVIEKGRTTSDTLARAQKYLEEKEGQAIFVKESLPKSGSVAEAIMKTAEAHECDLIITGGYGYNPVVEIVLGSTVDEVLRTSRKPILICR